MQQSISPLNLSLESVTQSYTSGEVTPRTLILQLREQALAQSDYNAWIHLMSEQELEPYLARLEALSPDDLPLYGIPFAIKDNIDLAGIPTTAACPDFAYEPEESAFVVQQLIDAGAIPLGKTNLDQFATGLVGVRSPYGEGKNSFNPDYISGGSSSGSAIATALAQVSFALGTDTAGSGRVPAVLNNLIGHKPTKGLLSNRGLVPACKSLDCISIFALNTQDTASILNIVAKYDRADPYARKNALGNTLRTFSTTIPKGITVGVPATLDFQGNEHTQNMFAESVQQLETLGAKIKTIDLNPFIEAAKLLYEGPWVAERYLATRTIQPESRLNVINTIVSQAEKQTVADCFTALYRLQELKRACDDTMESVDCLVLPTSPTFYRRTELEEKPIEYNSIMGTYTNFVNLLDYSATAVPTGFTPCGVPWGVTLIGKAFEDYRLLGFAGALQQSYNNPQGATEYPLAQSSITPTLTNPQTIDIVVCGAHLKDQPLNWQLTERGGVFKELTHSSFHYSLYALLDGKRPAMVRTHQDGCGHAIEIEVWSLPLEALGSFVAHIPAPLGIGKVETIDGRWLCGFVCEAEGHAGARDISSYGGWRHWLATRE